jgi:hypothetical protein
MNEPARLRQPSDNFVDAIYRPSEVPEFSGNPLIEALPSILDDEAWAELLGTYPRIHASERELPVHLRSYFVLRLQRYFLPLPRHIELAQRIGLIIRNGYLGRNPLTADRGRLLQKAYQSVQEEKQAGVTFKDFNPAVSMALMGFSGMGKTTSVERILGTYPQVIFHKEYALHQVVWLKIDCPKGGSTRQLGFDFFSALDGLLGTRHRDEFSDRSHADGLLSSAKHYAVVYNLGVLVIDEIQNLAVKKSGGREEMLNFFQEICNTLSVPVVLMGTNKALKTLQPDFRQARRNAGIGAFIWEAMPNDDEWQFAVEDMWQYQWVRKPVPFSPDIAESLYKPIQGIRAILGTAFQLAQLRAMRTGEETVTPETITRIIEREFQPVLPMLKALASRDPRRLRNYEDILPMDFEELMRKAQMEITASKPASIRKSESRPSLSAEEANAVTALELMGFDAHIAENAVTEAKGLLKNPKTQGLVKKALELLTNPEPQLDLDANDPDDLRRQENLHG